MSRWSEMRPTAIAPTTRTIPAITRGSRAARANMSVLLQRLADFLSQREDRLVELLDALVLLDHQLVLLLLLLDHHVLLVREDLPARIRPVLADHHEGREEDRLEADDHRQEAERVLLDRERDPEHEREDVHVDEDHRPSK